ncbi:MAG: hypothetical protein J6N72_03390 [Psychrobacter sp.]|nr:hypothetical protein [Psychrobacter sp.]
MNLSFLKAAMVAAVLSVTTGCASNSLINKESDLINIRSSYQQPKDVLSIISQESQEALNAQKRLVAYREAENQRLALNARLIETDQVLVDYVGKPQPLISSIAIQYGYRFVENGVRTDLPTVNFTNLYQTPEQTLIDLSAKIIPMASIAINKQDKIITLVYSN